MTGNADVVPAMAITSIPSVLLPLRAPGLIPAYTPPVALSPQGIFNRIVDSSLTTGKVGLELGIPQAVKDAAQAYLVIMVEDHRAERLDEDVAATAELVTELGAIDVFVLPPAAGNQLLAAREQAFWVAKELGANDIVDVVVPRASVPDFLSRVFEIAAANATLVGAAGHAGDGNVHLSVFQPDAAVRSSVMKQILGAGIELGGAISAEHGIGREKQAYFLELEDPVKIALMQRIKTAFDPHGILNPGVLLPGTDA